LKSDVAVFQNENDRADFARMGVLPAKVKTSLVNGSGVDLDHYAPSPPPAEPSFLMIARLLGDKGVREYGEAARRLKQIYPEARISLLGGIGTEPDAVSREELDRFIGWGSTISAPARRRAPLHRRPQRLRPSLLPRRHAALGAGGALDRARGHHHRRAGLPPNRRAGRNGLLVPPRDADALFEAMRHFIENPQVIGRWAAASRQIAEDKYDVRKVNAALLAAIGALAQLLPVERRVYGAADHERPHLRDSFYRRFGKRLFDSRRRGRADRALAGHRRRGAAGGAQARTTRAVPPATLRPQRPAVPARQVPLDDRRAGCGRAPPARTRCG
jgi:hypothetical protein